MAKKLFISYSHADARLLERLHKHLAQLKREGSVSEWFDREITAGGRIDDEIRKELAEADIYLAALSPDFIASSYCFDVELQNALEREQRGELIIVPVIFEPCDWLATPLGKFKALPEDGRPISEFANENVALLSVTSELRRLIEQSGRSVEIKGMAAASAVPASGGSSPRSRYRIRREHDQIDKRDFTERAFAEIKKFFQSSVEEINTIPEIQAELRDHGPESFSCTVVNRGLRRKYETLHVRRGGRFADIDISYGERLTDNSSHGGFAVKSDDYEMYLSGTLFSFRGNSQDRLTASEAARLLWDDLLSKVGVDYA